MTKLVNINTGDLAIVDDDTPEWILQKTWTESSNTSPQCSYKGKHYNLHQAILPRKEGYIIDHISGDVLDCRKANLRYVTYNQNSWNQKTLGITFHANGWQVQIQKNLKEIYIGRFKTFDEAKEARIKAEVDRDPAFIRDIRMWSEVYYWLNRQKPRRKKSA